MEHSLIGILNLLVLRNMGKFLKDYKEDNQGESSNLKKIKLS